MTDGIMLDEAEINIVAIALSKVDPLEIIDQANNVRGKIQEYVSRKERERATDEAVAEHIAAEEPA